MVVTMESFKIKLVKDGKTLLFADLLGTKEKEKLNIYSSYKEMKKMETPKFPIEQFALRMSSRASENERREFIFDFTINNIDIFSCNEFMQDDDDIYCEIKSDDSLSKFKCSVQAYESNSDVLILTIEIKSKIETNVSRCKRIGSRRVRGAKPPDFEGVESPKHCPKWSQTDLPKSSPDSQPKTLRVLRKRLPDGPRTSRESK